MLLDPQKLEPRVVARRPVKIRSVPGGESVMRLILGRRLVNLLPLAHRTKTFTIYPPFGVSKMVFPVYENGVSDFFFACPIERGVIRKTRVCSRG